MSGIWGTNASPSEVRAVEAQVAVLREVHNDWYVWENSLNNGNPPANKNLILHPPVDGPDGLPDGWTLRGTGRATNPGEEDWFLATRPQGGCVVLHRRPGTDEHTRIVWFSVNLADLHASLHDKVHGIGHHGQIQQPQPELAADLVWLEAALSRMYDDNNPAEAAEKALMALGNPMVVLPAAAYTNGYAPDLTAHTAGVR